MKQLSLVLLLVLGSAVSLVAQRTIQGTITDDAGEPLIGATVLVKGTSSGTVTDIDGQYSLNVPVGANSLVYSYTGYVTQEVAIGASNVMDVTMEPDVAQLDEVIVTGFGTQSRRLSTSSVASVDNKAFENVSVQSFDNALAGRLPGVSVQSNSGTLGSQSQIRVRGVGSIGASNQPIFVVDGLIINDNVDGFNLGGPGTNPLININPDDIASIDVLKDAAATSIYGARGANGVIVITTKAGSYNQKPQVNLGYYTGFSDPTNQYDLLNGQQYAELWNRAADAVGSDLKYPDPASEPSTDWLEEVSRTGTVNNVTAGVSGGTQTAKYFFGGTFRDENGWIESTNLKRYSFRANIEQQLSDKWLAGINLNPSRTVNLRQNEDNNVASPQTYAALFFPNVAARDEDGNVLGGIQPTSIGLTQFAGTPLGNIVGQDINLTTNQILGRLYTEFRPMNKLKLRTEFSGQLQEVVDNVKQSSQTTDGFGAGGTGDAANSNALAWNWNSFATYTDAIGRHNFDATLGFSLQREEQSSFSVFGNNFADDRLITLDNAAEITGGGGNRTEANFVGYLGRINYNFDNKYLLTLSGRYDGSSRFGENNRYGFFPGVSAGWVISEEPFMQNSSFFDFLKVRGSWGLSGNAEIGNFAARGLVGFGRDYNFIPGFRNNQLQNSDLEWEKAETVDFGVDFGFLDNRVRGSVVYYIKDTRDLILNAPLPATIGIDNAGLQQNIGEMRNQGFEFNVDLDIVRSSAPKGFNFTLGFNGATLNNEVLRLVDNDGDGEDDDIVNGRNLIRTGETVGSWYTMEYAGVDPANGDALFRDSEGNVSNAYPAGTERQIFGNPLPDFSGGITTTFTFAGFDLNAFFNFATGHQLYLSEGRFYGINMGSVWNQSVDQLNAWTPENTDTDIPEARLLTTNGSQHSTRYLDDADFIRLKNVQLGYTFPAFGKNNTSVRVFAAGQNLLTWTDFAGLDPEANGDNQDSVYSGDLFFSRPQSRTITFGVNLDF